LRTLEEIKAEFTRIAKATGDDRLLESNLHELDDALGECQPFDMVAAARRAVELREHALHVMHDQKLGEEAGELIDDIANLAAAHCSCNAKSP
jgi:hypothetical protein